MTDQVELLDEPESIPAVAPLVQRELYIRLLMGEAGAEAILPLKRGADGARNYTQCDSLLIGKQCGAHTFPYIEVKNPGATVEHEATTSKISDDQLFYCRARGISQEDAVSMIVDGFCKQVFRELPMEFAVEAKKLLEVSLEGSVG